jgi:thioredoxin 2
MTEPLTISCPSCDAINRVPREKLGRGLEPICGRCKGPLPFENKSILVNDTNFRAEVERSPVPMLLDMWAPWCGPCRMVAPIVDELAAEMAGRIRVGKLNVDENPLTAERFHIRGIPALLVLKAGREVDRIVGAQPKSEIIRPLEQAISE